LLQAALASIYAVALHDALPILHAGRRRGAGIEVGGESNRRAGIDQAACGSVAALAEKEQRRRQQRRYSVRAGERRDSLVTDRAEDRKSTRLNSSHVKISYAAFC